MPETLKILACHYFCTIMYERILSEALLSDRKFALYL